MQVYFNIRMIRPGEYGAASSLIAEEPMIEFYDPRYNDERFTPYGQYVTRYYARTLADQVGAGELRLMGHVRQWTVCAAQMEAVREIAKRLVEECPEEVRRDASN